MPEDDWEFIPNGWTNSEQDMWQNVTEGTGALNDEVAQALFNEAYFNFDLSSDQIGAIRDALDGYMMDQYGLDFDEVFDWEAYREAYS